MQEAKQVALQQLLDQAFDHLAFSRLDEALEACKQVLSVQAQHPQALHYVGLIAYQRGEHGSAVEFLQRAVQREPGAAVCSNLGLALHASCDLYGAIAMHQAALRFKPEHAASHNNLANALKEIGNIDAAIKHYRTAIKNAPDLAPAIQNLKSVFDSVRFVKVQLEASAIKVDFECNFFSVGDLQVPYVLPDSPNFFSVLAATIVKRAIEFLEVGDLARAEDLCQTLRRIIPNQADALYLLGAMANCRGRHALGAALIQKACGFDSTLAEKYQGLALPEGANSAGSTDIVEIVSATRMSEDMFWANSALGQSLRSLGGDRRIVANVAFNNLRGLPEIYNARIGQEGEDRILVFIHDDVWIDDLFFVDRLVRALESFDVIGVAGNRVRLPRQAGWSFLDASLTPSNLVDLRGCISHGADQFGKTDAFGESPAPCELLDGVILAARKTRLQTMGVQFDPLFKFHFYDIDFCRSARQAGLSVGTWPLYLTHQSKGAFRSESWKDTYAVYLDKWRD
jgi:tetratricopeptide (TPR) repeat protein